jgi:hypothetical protein
MRANLRFHVCPLTEFFASLAQPPRHESAFQSESLRALFHPFAHWHTRVRNSGFPPIADGYFWVGPRRLRAICCRSRTCRFQVPLRQLRPHQRHSKCQEISSDSKVMDVRYWVLLRRALLQPSSSAFDPGCVKTINCARCLEIYSQILPSADWRCSQRFCCTAFVK